MSDVINNYYNELVILMIGICLIGVLIMLIPIFQTKKQNNKIMEDADLNEDEIKKIDATLDKEKLKKEIFSLYKKVEVAKTKFDYNTLKETLDESLYQEEEQNLKKLKKEKQKLVATNIKLQEIKFLSIENNKDIETIKIYLHVSQYDYIIDNKKKIIRGTDDSVYQIEYKITLEKNKDKQFKIKTKECIGKWIKNN